MQSIFSDLPSPIFVTGGCGFIGSAVIRLLLSETAAEVVNIDKLTYAASPDSVRSVAANPRYGFAEVDICDQPAIRDLFERRRPAAVLHLAAETHVDRSIDGPGVFVQTNIVGTYALLEEARRYWLDLDQEGQQRFRFQHISTDEVFGSLGSEGHFVETTRYDPSSPYSASKAAADHLVRAWGRTFDLPILVSNCSNNYGPYHFPEKLIPLTILNAIEGKPLPVYGKGENVRDWLYVEDHARALVAVLAGGTPGETYNVGGLSERRNIDVVRTICAILDRALPESPFRPHDALIRFVADRPGHDARYAIDPTKIMGALGWRPRETFESGLEKTVRWYLDNRSWWEAIRARIYDGSRLGAPGAARA